MHLPFFLWLSANWQIWFSLWKSAICFLHFEQYSILEPQRTWCSSKDSISWRIWQNSQGNLPSSELKLFIFTLWLEFRATAKNWNNMGNLVKYISMLIIFLPMAPMRWSLACIPWFCKMFRQTTFRKIGCLTFIHPSLFLIEKSVGLEAAWFGWMELGTTSTCSKEFFKLSFFVSLCVSLKVLWLVWPVDDFVASWSLMWFFIIRTKMKLEQISHFSVLLPQADWCSSSWDTKQSSSQNSHCLVFFGQFFSYERFEISSSNLFIE